MNPFDPGYYETDELRTFGFKSVGDHVRIAKNCTIIGLENISIGDHVRIDASTSIICPRGTIALAGNIHIATGCLIGGRGGVSIGRYCVVSHGSRIFSASDDFSGAAMTSCEVPAAWTMVDVAPVVMRDHAAIGANSVILPGVTFGEGAALGCLSLATSDLPEWTISSGRPAVAFKRRRNDLLRFVEQQRALAA